MRAIITIGVSASGKTTWATEFARENSYHIVCRDDVRAELIPAPFSWDAWFKWARKNKGEQLVTEKCQEQIKNHAGLKHDIIIADTNLNKDRLDQLQRFLTSLGYIVDIKIFWAEYAELCKRDAARPNGVGPSVIAKQLEQFDELLNSFKMKKPVNKDKNLQRAIIFDVDGTLAHMNGRSPYAWDKINEDVADEGLFRILAALMVASDVQIIILSGRDGVCKEETGSWIERQLAEYNIYPMKDEILHFQRAADDNRKDIVIKEEMYFEHIADKYHVVGVFDDRPVVCRMWRTLGLPVFQCGNPYIEF